jgi:hypothetical protein
MNLKMRVALHVESGLHSWWGDSPTKSSSLRTSIIVPSLLHSRILILMFFLSLFSPLVCLVPTCAFYLPCRPSLFALRSLKNPSWSHIESSWFPSYVSEELLPHLPLLQGLTDFLRLFFPHAHGIICVISPSASGNCSTFNAGDKHYTWKILSTSQTD